MWKNLLCDVYAFLDNDSDGKRAFTEASSKAGLTLNNVTFTTMNDHYETELEDLILPDVYKIEVKKLGVNLDKSIAFNNKKKKWSIRIKDAFKEQGKPWDENIENQIKLTVTQKSIEKGISSIHSKNQTPIRKFITDIEDHLEKLEKSTNRT